LLVLQGDFNAINNSKEVVPQLKRKCTSLTAVTFSSEYSSFLIQLKVFHIMLGPMPSFEC